MLFGFVLYSSFPLLLLTHLLCTLCLLSQDGTFGSARLEANFAGGGGYRGGGGGTGHQSGKSKVMFSFLQTLLMRFSVHDTSDSCAGLL